MKKLILSLLMMCFVFATSAQQDTTIYSTETGVVVNEVMTRVETAIGTLATKLQQPAEHVYKVLVKQQTVKSYINIAICAFLILLSIILFIILFITWKRHNYTGDNVNDLWITFAIVDVISFLVGIIWALAASEIVITGLVNPEYGAIKEILRYL